MKTFISLLIFLAGSGFTLIAQTPLRIEVAQNGTTEVSGNLSDGTIMPTLSWAWNSSVACFPETEKDHFTGHHVLYTFDLPSYTEMEIKVVPDNQEHDFSLYAYEVGKLTENNTVPYLSSCVRCEADHQWDRPKKGQIQNHTRMVKDILALRNPYQVVVGVVGANGLSEGAYRLIITSKSR